MKAPINSMKLADIRWLGNHNCKAHHHSYLSHYECYLRDKPMESPFQERVGIFDLETSGLKADFAYIFSYAILDDATDKVYGRVLTPHEIRSSVFDKNLVGEMCRDLKRFNRIIVHYGGDRRFDCPFARTRSIKYGHDFPLYKDIFVSDTWLMSKNKLKLRSNRLAVICEFFGIEAKTHPLTPDIWQRASAGVKKDLDFIWTHNIEDVRSTKKVYHLFESYVNRGKTSI
jgi:uncharacterized protein YprB with RNaseH-like and TPR domain